MPAITEQSPTQLQEKRYLKNNDALAHVSLFMGEYDEATAEYRTYIEYVTDMGERLVEQPFRKTFSYKKTKEGFMSSTGLVLDDFLQNGYEAAVNDVRAGRFDSYHAARNEGFLNQLAILKQWEEQGEDTHLLLFSLCPPSSELPKPEAIRQSFKPDRMMASVQLYEKTNDGISLHAFSLDGLTLDRLNMLYKVMGSNTQVASTTLEQLTKPLYTDAHMTAADTIDSLTYHYDSILHNETGKYSTQGVDSARFKHEANSFVAEQQEAYSLYLQTVKEVARSLETGIVNLRLGAITNELKSSILAAHASVPNCLLLESGQYIDRTSASGVIDYLRTKAIPQYLMNMLHAPNNDSEVTSGSYEGYQGVSDAGGQAVAQNRTYDGACPSSVEQMTLSSELSDLSSVFVGAYKQAALREAWTWTTGKCVVNNCPSRPAKTEVGPCSVCKGCQSIFDDGKDPHKIYGKKDKSITQLFEELIASIVESPKPKTSTQKS